MTELLPVRHAAAPRRDAPVAGRRAQATPRSGGWRIADAALTLAAIGGVICIAAVIAATFLSVTLIMFKTGSMSPTIPAGSLAVVREIAASEAAVGDVVTVDRPGMLPITHRVTSTTPATDGYTSITMKGDANRDPDPDPYVVSTVRIVLVAVPGLASAVVGMSNPLVLGSITLGAAALVTWAFWPRGSRGPGGPGASRQRHRVSAGVAAVVLVGLVPMALPAAPARAAEVETVVRGKYLTLRSIADSAAMESMTPGRPVPWQVGVSVAAPEPGVVHVGISAEGGLVNPGALQLEIRSCAQRWIGGVCATGAALWLPLQDITVAAEPTEPNGVRELDTLASDHTAWLMITVVMPTEAEPGAEARLNIHAWGEGNPVQVASDPQRGSGLSASALAHTGAVVGYPLALAIAAILAGLALAGVARLGALRRRDREEAS